MKQGFLLYCTTPKNKRRQIYKESYECKKEGSNFKISSMQRVNAVVISKPPVLFIVSFFLSSFFFHFTVMGCAIVHDAVDADMLHETISFSYCGTPTSNEWNDHCVKKCRLQPADVSTNIKAYRWLFDISSVSQTRPVADLVNVRM